MPSAQRGDGRKTRLELMEKLQQKRANTVLCYFTGDRLNMTTKIGNDAVPIIAEHLRELRPASVDLVIYSLGGDVMAALSIMRCIRGFASTYHVLVPFRAFSAATLIAAGADSIVMGPLGQLGPVDPTITTPYCPTAPGGAPGQYLGVSVEEVNAYIDLSRRVMGETDQATRVAFEHLASDLHPLALGAVERARTQNAGILKAALLSHMSPEDVESEKLKRCVQELTQALPSHGYPICFDEAVEMGLPVQKADQETEELLWSLYTEYANMMELGNPFVPLAYAPDATTTKTKTARFTPAIIESGHALDAYTIELDLTWEKQEVILPD
ncbi:MAG: SDH family Clp fold serine proteinase, partial [Planctomycetota bacterium]